MQRWSVCAKPLEGRPITKSTRFSRSPSNSTSPNGSSSSTGLNSGSGLGGSPCSRAEGLRIALPSSASIWRTKLYLFSLPSPGEVPTKACSALVLATMTVGPSSRAIPAATSASNSSTVRTSATWARPEARATPAMSTGPADSEATDRHFPVET